MDAEGPILLIPKHAFSPELMVGDIGHVRVTNSSRYDGEEGTIAFTRKQQEASQVGDKKRSRSNSDLSSNGLPKSDLHPLMQSSTSSRLMSSLSKSSMSYSSYVKLFDRDATSPPADAVGVSAAPSMFGPLKSSSSLGRRPPSHLVIDEETEIGRKVEARSGPCLLDCIEMDLTEVDVFSAKREQTAGGKDSFRIVRQVSEAVVFIMQIQLYMYTGVVVVHVILNSNFCGLQKCSCTCTCTMYSSVQYTLYMYMYIYICMCNVMSIHVHVCVHIVYIFSMCTCVCTYTCTMYMHMYTCTCTVLSPNIHVYMYMYMYMYNAIFKILQSGLYLLVSYLKFDFYIFL